MSQVHQVQGTALPAGPRGASRRGVVSRGTDMQPRGLRRTSVHPGAKGDPPFQDGPGLLLRRPDARAPCPGRYACPGAEPGRGTRRSEANVDEGASGAEKTAPHSASLRGDRVQGEAHPGPRGVRTTDGVASGRVQGATLLPYRKQGSRRTGREAIRTRVFKIPRNPFHADGLGPGRSLGWTPEEGNRQRSSLRRITPQAVARATRELARVPTR
jgi:hypothetical protein